MKIFKWTLGAILAQKQKLEIKVKNVFDSWKNAGFKTPSKPAE